MNKIIVGDCQETMRTLIAEGVKVQICVTSPPYWGLRDYGCAGQLGLEPTIQEYVAGMVEVFGLVRELLADNGTLWLNLGDSYASSPVGSFNGGGFKDSSAKSGGRDLSAVATSGKADKLKGSGLKPKDLCGIPWRVAFALQTAGCADLHAVQTIERVRSKLIESYDGDPLPDRVIAALESLNAEYAQAKGSTWWLRQDIIWAKPNPMPESVTDRCTKSHEYLFLMAKSERYLCDMEAIKEPAVADHAPGNNSHKQTDAYEAGDERMRTKAGLVGYAQRQRKPAGWDTGAGSHGTIHRDGRAKEVEYTDVVANTRNRRSVWTVATQPYAEAHFATYPPALIEPCILAGSRPGDIVFDPFMGSGTTAEVAQRLGRNWLGCELNPAYAELARKRTSTTIGMALA